MNIQKKIKDVKCPQCKKNFKLSWEGTDYSNNKYPLIIRSCPSGGVYDVSIHCPHCNYEEEL